MKKVTFNFVSKEAMSGLRKMDSDLSEDFYQAVTDSSISSHYVKYPFTVAGWYIEDNKAGKQLVEDWKESFEEANQATKEKAPTAKPEAKKGKLSNGELLQEYGKLQAKNKKSAADKKRISAIEALIS